MKAHALKALAAAAALAACGTALADITIGVIAPLTGPASGLGIPAGNEVKLWPKEIAGEKLNVILMDDASDPTQGVTNAKRFVSQDKVDVIMGSVATPVAAQTVEAVRAGIRCGSQGDNAVGIQGVGVVGAHKGLGKADKGPRRVRKLAKRGSVHQHFAL